MAREYRDDCPVGLTILPEYFQTEGVARVLDNVMSVGGVTAIATGAYVMEEVPVGTGYREPPIDGGAGKVRVLQRELWGKSELWMNVAPSYAPNRELYSGLRYQPWEPNALTERAGPVVESAIHEAKTRGLRVELLIQAAVPPGYRFQIGGPEEIDLPRLPNGASPTGRVDNNGSLASPEILAYTQALLKDLLTRYPEVDAVRLDWPDYPPYSFESIFFDCSDYACEFGRAMGFDVDRIVSEMDRIFSSSFGSLNSERAKLLAEHTAYPYGILEALLRAPVVLEFLRWKREIVTQFIVGLGETITEIDGKSYELVLQTFPPPWTSLSGIDIRAVTRRVPAARISMKLFTMHWPMMLHSYAEAIEGQESVRSSTNVAGMLASLFDTDDGPPHLMSDRRDLRYPQPGEAHPVSDGSLDRKIRAAGLESQGHAIVPMVHAYGPEEDFERRVAACLRASGGRLWVNRYGYLSDHKLERLGRIVRETAET